MRIAVVGASGFVGRYVLDRLSLMADAEVVATSRRGISPTPSPEGIEWIALDLAAPGEYLFDRLGKPDVLIHLAWEGLPNYGECRHFDVEAPRHYRFLIDLARAGLRRVLITGTCFEYGMREGRLAETLPTEPFNQYGLAKDILRRQLEMALPSLGCGLLWARLFYMFGEGQNPTSLYPSVMRACAERAKRFPMSGGEQLRDFLPIRSVADYIVRLAIESDATGIVNVGSGVPHSVRAMVEGWIRGAGHDLTLELGHYPYPDYEPFAFWADTDRLTALLATQ